MLTSQNTRSRNARNKVRKNQQVQMTEEKAKEDWADFALKHPDVELDDLMKDERFLDYADGKIGRKPLAQIYDNYLTKFNVPKKEEPPIVKQSPGSLGQGATRTGRHILKSGI